MKLTEMKLNVLYLEGRSEGSRHRGVIVKRQVMYNRPVADLFLQDNDCSHPSTGFAIKLMQTCNKSKTHHCTMSIRYIIQRVIFYKLSKTNQCSHFDVADDTIVQSLLNID